MRRWIGLAVSLALLALLWAKVDVRAILAATRGADPWRLGLGLFMAVPLTLVTAWRFGLISRTPIAVGAALRLVLAASTLNLVLPSKMGDIAKAWVLRQKYAFDGGDALALVVLEKMIDMAALLVWGVLALWIVADSPAMLMLAVVLAGLLALLLAALAPLPLATGLVRLATPWLPGPLRAAAADFAGRWEAIIRWFWRDRGHAAFVALVSLLLWAGHLAQIWLFARSLAPGVPLLSSMACATLAILAGLLPFTVAGVGTRDAAIVLLFAPWLSAGQGAALGVLATTRYLLPALAGLPFMSDYWARRADMRAGDGHG